VTMWLCRFPSPTTKSKQLHEKSLVMYEED
jgi:hypothetical protein